MSLEQPRLFSPRRRCRVRGPRRVLAALFGAALSAATPAGAQTPNPPQINAVSYLLMDAATGAYLAEKNTENRVEPASLTMMMTAYVVARQLARNQLSLEDKVVVSEKAWRMKGSRMFIEVGKEVSVDALLKGVIIQSGNDASVALAEYVAGTEDEFAALMNQQARTLGMNDTHFVNSSGWPDENHYTTAKDLALLARGLIRDYPEVYALHAVKEFVYNGIKQFNRNALLWRDDSVDGIKTGRTDSAGYCLVASAERKGMRLISVIMGADGAQARTNATRALLNYGYRFFETRQLHAAGAAIAARKVWKGERDSVDLTLAEDLWLTLPKGQHQRLERRVETEDALIAPLAAGQEVGRLTLRADGETIAVRPLITLEAVPAGGFWIRLRDGAQLYLNSRSQAAAPAPEPAPASESAPAPEPAPASESAPASEPPPASESAPPAP